MFGLNPEEIIHVSAKTGKGVDVLLEAIVERIPPPEGAIRGPLKALLFDSSWVVSLGSKHVHLACAQNVFCRYDRYRGVISLVKVESGELRRGLFTHRYHHVHCAESSIVLGDKIGSCHTQKRYEVTEVGIMHPEQVSTGVLYTGQVGYIACNMKDPAEGVLSVHLML